jgi:hypothetical protein
VSSHLKQLESRVRELTELGREVLKRAAARADGNIVDALGLEEVTENWFRGSRALLVRENFSGLRDFDWCYEAYYPDIHDKTKLSKDWSCISMFVYYPAGNRQHDKLNLPYFSRKVTKCMALVASCVSEVKSRELAIIGELSYIVAADEFDTAKSLLDSSQDDTIVRASGIVGRVALERHIRTVAEQHPEITIIKNPPGKAHADFSDYTLSLKKADVITEVQRARLDTLYRIGNNCAHAKEIVSRHDVEDLIRDGKSFAGLIG